MARPNYITNMIKQYGDNWIVALKPEDIQRSGNRIFKEMVKGNFNYEEVGNYFLDGKFLDNLIIACSNELQVNTLYFTALQFYLQYNPNIQDGPAELSHLQSLCYIYNVILNKLTAVKQTNNIGWLADTSATLFSYRNHLK